MKWNQIEGELQVKADEIMVVVVSAVVVMVVCCTILRETKLFGSGNLGALAQVAGGRCRVAGAGTGKSTGKR